LDSVEFLDIRAQCPIRIFPEDVVVKDLLAFYIVASSADGVGSAVVLSGSIYDLKVVFSEDL
jgi:hypothetical protein